MCWETKVYVELTFYNRIVILLHQNIKLIYTFHSLENLDRKIGLLLQEYQEAYCQDLLLEAWI